jgi:hypothetical protein
MLRVTEPESYEMAPVPISIHWLGFRVDYELTADLVYL